MKAKLLVVLVLALVVGVFSWLWLDEKNKLVNMNRVVSEAQNRAATSRDDLMKIQDLNAMQKRSIDELTQKTGYLEERLSNELEKQRQMESAIRSSEKLLQAARDESKGFSEELARGLKREETEKFRISELEKNAADLAGRLKQAEELLAASGRHLPKEGETAPCPPGESAKLKEELMAEAAGIRLEISRAQAELSNLRDQLTRDYDKMASLKRDLAALSARKEGAAPQDGSLTQAYETLSREFKDPIEKGTVSLAQINGSLTLSFATDMLYGGAASLSPEGQRILDAAAVVIQTASPGKVLVSAYSDSQPPAKAHIRQYPSNWELTAAQAGAAVNYLVEKKHFNPSIIKAEGRADSDPVAPNDTPENMAKNRRLELSVSKN